MVVGGGSDSPPRGRPGRGDKHCASDQVSGFWRWELAGPTRDHFANLLDRQFNIAVRGIKTQTARLFNQRGANQASLKTREEPSQMPSVSGFPPTDLLRQSPPVNNRHQEKKKKKKSHISCKNPSGIRNLISRSCAVHFASPLRLRTRKSKFKCTIST